MSHSLNLSDWTFVVFLKCDTIPWMSCIRFQFNFWQEYFTGGVVYFLLHHMKRYIMSNYFSMISFHLKPHFLQLWDFFFNVYLFWKRERVWAGEGQKENPKQALHCQHRVRWRAWSHNQWGHDLSQNQGLVTQPTKPARCPQLWDIFVKSFFGDVFPPSPYFLCLHFLELIIQIAELLEWFSNIFFFPLIFL